METIEISKLVASLTSGDTWALLAVVVLFGAIGGYAHKLTASPEDKTTPLGYIVVGAVGALAVLFVFVPKDPVRLIALAVSAGYGGKALLDALEGRIKAAVAEAEIGKLKDNGRNAVAVGKEAIERARKSAGAGNVVAPENIGAEKDELSRLSNRLDFLNESFAEK